MNKLSLENKLKELKRQIQYHDHRYYILSDPCISDAEYDILFKEFVYLKSSLSKSSALDSSLVEIGHGKPSNKFKKCKHFVPMLSLSNGFTQEDVINFDKKVRSISEQVGYFCDPKFDGVAISLIYENSILKMAGTRGNGLVGEDVTENIKRVDAIPKRLRRYSPGIMEVRGEVFMLIKDFNRINQNRIHLKKKVFVNPRNAASGSLLSLDSSEIEDRNLQFIAYGWGRIELNNLSNDSTLKKKQLKNTFSTYKSVLDWIHDLGFPISQYCSITEDVSGLINFYNKLSEIRTDLPYEIDGVVYKVSSLHLQEILGYNNRAPKFSLAHKYNAKKSFAKLLGIDVQVGRTGVLTPIALISPTLVGGVMIRRATLHNINEIKRIGLRIGDSVIIQRAGDVIPKIVGINSERNTNRNKFKYFQMPLLCPACGSFIKRINNEIAYRCTGFLICPEQLKYRLLHATGRDALNIIGCGEKIIEMLIKQYHVRNIADIYKIKKEQLLKIKGFGKKSAENLFTMIQKSRLEKIKFSTLIFSLGIHHVGYTVSEKLANYFGNLDRFLSTNINSILKVPGVGQVTAQYINNFLQEKENIIAVRELMHYITIQNDTLDKKIFLGKHFSFTGSLFQLTRQEACKLILKNGGKIDRSLRKETHYLIVGKSPGSTLRKGLFYKTKLVSECGFFNLINGTIIAIPL